mmetsp:Transcript_21566/g.51485  ORF Transcript_21566/g.51485 Transcript_21566/m.51485 type:complete len:105 (+) Transcript_21566:246-560(+)
MASGGPSAAEIPAWRVDVLYFALLLTTFLLTKGDQLLLRHLHWRHKTGFIQIYEALKEELLLLGIISLLLTGYLTEPSYNPLSVVSPFVEYLPNGGTRKSERTR